MSIPSKFTPSILAAEYAGTSDIRAMPWAPTATACALTDVIRTCAREFGCDFCAITLENGETETLAAYGRGRRIAEVTVVHGDAVLTSPEAPKTIEDMETGLRLRFHSRLRIPLQSERGHVGTIVLYTRRQGAFDWAGEAHRRTVGELAGARIAEARQHDRTQRLAFMDGLTGFFSRAYYLERLAEAIAHARRYDEPLAVVAYDFDGLKQANEAYGYEAGSQLMADTTHDQRRHLRRSDIPCRIMGDEYSIIAPHTDMDGGLALAHQIQAAAEVLEVLVPAKNTRTGSAAVFHSAISVGIAVLDLDNLKPDNFMPDDDEKTLTSRALRAVQADKQCRRALNQSLQAMRQEQESIAFNNPEQTINDPEQTIPSRFITNVH